MDFSNLSYFWMLLKNEEKEFSLCLLLFFSQGGVLYWFKMISFYKFLSSGI